MLNDPVPATILDYTTTAQDSLWRPFCVFLLRLGAFQGCLEHLAKLR